MASNKQRIKVFSVGIEDCDVSCFTVGGNGGGGKDTSNTGVRVSHQPSGASGRATDTRSQLKNKQLAFRRMAETREFQAWAQLEAARRSGAKSIDTLVNEAMEPTNLKIETYAGGRWTDAD
jgi:protein subunit release factor A